MSFKILNNMTSYMLLNKNKNKNLHSSIDSHKSQGSCNHQYFHHLSFYFLGTKHYKLSPIWALIIFLTLFQIQWAGLKS
jgi:hypothetical protein